MRTHALLAVAVLTLLPTPVDAQAWPVWLNDRMDEAVAARLAQRGSGRQVEAPSIARGSTALVDHASFADLVGMAMINSLRWAHNFWASL